MRKELVWTAMVSATIGAGLMLLATGGRPPAGIEGWTPVNAQVEAALAQEGRGGAVSETPGSAKRGGGESPSQPATAVAGEAGTTAAAAERSAGGTGSDSAATAATAGNPGLGAGSEGASEAAPSAAGAGKSAEAGRISINRAGLAELQEIPGIGEKKAQAILDYRNAHGAFASIEDLTLVKGIGDKLLEKMKPYVGL